MSLTDTAIKKAKPEAKQRKLYDERGLFLLVSPKGGKWWRFKYLFDGKEKLLSLGTYPDVSLKDARERRDEARKQVAAGIDPGEHRKAARSARIAKQVNSFEVVAREWFAREKCPTESDNCQPSFHLPLVADSFSALTPLTRQRRLLRGQKT